MSSFTAGFVGLGLIGGSIARAMKHYYPDCRILAFNRSHSTLDYALAEGIIDEAFPPSMKPLLPVIRFFSVRRWKRMLPVCRF